ncbi:MAG: VWA domain-containing protein [Planctomycetes bacterium]|nr:VWA domain-containing protein [Planctomycetota bacterium]
MQRFSFSPVAPRAALFFLAAFLASARAVSAQDAAFSQVVLPQARGFALNRADQPIAVERVDARVTIVERAARTTLEVALRNPGARPAEAVFLVPVPDGAVVSEFLFEGNAPAGRAEVLPRAEARRLYDQIVAQIRDPALLEFAGFNLVRSSVFPVPAGGAQRVRLTYEHLLEADGGRVDYFLPRSEALDQSTPWTMTVEVKSARPISMFYSPTHDLETLAKEPGRAFVRSTREAARNPGAFLFSFLLEEDGVSASLLAYPDPEAGGGYFLLMAGLPAAQGGAESPIRREVTVVVDRSGSMAGGKMDQVLAAVRQVLEGLSQGEAFNIVDYASAVESFAPGPVIKDRKQMLRARQYLEGIRPGGGTNIHDALLFALRQQPVPGMLPIVLFLTDGLPTIGRTAEEDIRAAAQLGNEHRRRVFTFGVGSDVNAPLLDRLAEASRARCTYVLEGEDVELKVAQVFKRLYGPVLADPVLEIQDASGAASTRLVRELIPRELPDLFAGDDLVLLGQYTQRAPATFRLSGNFLGQERAFSWTFDFAGESVKNAFVPRLWASRRIAFLIDQIRQAGGAAAGRPRSADADPARDPRFAELIDEILRLSTRFGILTEYTAFLAREGTDLNDWEALHAACNTNIDRRAVYTRSGVAGVNQALNFGQQKGQTILNYGNAFLDENLKRVAFSSVQQVCDRAFFLRGERWVDSRLAGLPRAPEPDEVIEFGSARHRALVDAFIASGRQGVLSLQGEILLPYEGKNLLIRNGVCR